MAVGRSHSKMELFGFLCHSRFHPRLISLSDSFLKNLPLVNLQESGIFRLVSHDPSANSLFVLHTITVYLFICIMTSSL